MHRVVTGDLAYHALDQKDESLIVAKSGFVPTGKHFVTPGQTATTLLHEERERRIRIMSRIQVARRLQRQGSYPLEHILGEGRS